MTAAPAHDDLPRWSEQLRRGVFRRRVRVSATGDAARGEVEDDVHRFSVDLAHDQRVVTAIRSEAQRYPWTVCTEAGANLARSIGAPIDRDVTALARWTSASENCTHRFDIAALAIAQAARGPGARQYDITVALGDRGPRRAMLRRDGSELLDWTLDGMTIHASDACGGHDLRRVLRWAEGALDPDAVEAVFAIRRGILVSNARIHDSERRFSPDEAMSVMAGACYVFHPGVVERAAVVPDNYRDFDAAPDRLLGPLD